jgi:hypothetical protein
MSLPRFFVGLSLGQAQEATAVAVIQHTGNVKEAVCHVPHLKRYALGTSYPEIVKDVAERLQKAPANACLILDATGVGQAVVELIRTHSLLSTRDANIHSVSVTGGEAEGREGRHWRVPKLNLVGAVQVLLQSQRLKIASDLPDTPALVNELGSFKVKVVTSVNESFSEWRERPQDDLVFAVAVACWAATNPSINSLGVRAVPFRRF